MGMTLAEKIMAKSSGKDSVSPGEIVKASVDLVVANDITAPLTFKSFEEMGFKEVWNADKTVIVLDHNIPPSDVGSASQMRLIREFCRTHGVKHFFDIGRAGIAHQVVQEFGFIVPGMLVIGADSHTCTGGSLGALAMGVGSTESAVAMGSGRLWFKVPESMKVNGEGSLIPPVSPKDLILEIIGKAGSDGATSKSIEYVGRCFREMSIGGRMTVANMSVEMGAKAGVVEADATTAEYLEARTKKSWSPVGADKDAVYSDVLEFDGSTLTPKIAAPPSVDNVKDATEIEGVEIDQVFLGSCTNGRLEDLKEAARILKGKTVHPRVRMVVMPASQRIYAEALREGIIEIFLESQAIVCGPSCGPCLGMSQGVLAEGEVCVSTSNRNFMSRMGHRDSKVYLASPATAAASALNGAITDPRAFY